MVGILSQFSQSVTILDSLWVFTAQLLAFDQVEPSRGESKSSWMMGEAAVPSYKKDKQCHFTRRINSAIIKKESSADPQSPMARSWQRQRWLMAASPRSWPQMGAGGGPLLVLVRNPSHLAIGHHRTFFLHISASAIIAAVENKRHTRGRQTQR